ncbi:hypothetical protein CPC08DRAFT_769408, partial [Agrocybe pediades]
VRKRDENFCCITRAFDYDGAASAQNFSHIPPAGIDVTFVAYFIPPPPSIIIDQLQAAYDILWAWANLTEEDWESKLDAPENALLVGGNSLALHHYLFTYFEENADLPNRYTARYAPESPQQQFFPTIDTSCEVVFRSLEESGVPPPDPRLVKAHCALVKLIDKSGCQAARVTVINELDRLDGMLDSDDDDKDVSDGEDLADG